MCTLYYIPLPFQPSDVVKVQDYAMYVISSMVDEDCYAYQLVPIFKCSLCYILEYPIISWLKAQYYNMYVSSSMVSDDSSAYQ